MPITRVKSICFEDEKSGDAAFAFGYSEECSVKPLTPVILPQDPVNKETTFLIGWKNSTTYNFLVRMRDIRHMTSDIFSEFLCGNMSTIYRLNLNGTGMEIYVNLDEVLSRKVVRKFPKECDILEAQVTEQCSKVPDNTLITFSSNKGFAEHYKGAREMVHAKYCEIIHAAIFNDNETTLPSTRYSHSWIGCMRDEHRLDSNVGFSFIVTNSMGISPKVRDMLANTSLTEPSREFTYNIGYSNVQMSEFQRRVLLRGIINTLVEEYTATAIMTNDDNVQVHCTKAKLAEVDRFLKNCA